MNERRKFAGRLAFLPWWTRPVGVIALVLALVFSFGASRSGLTAELATAQTERDDAESELDDLRSELSDANRALEQRERRVESLEQRVSNLRAELREIDTAQLAIVQAEAAEREAERVAAEKEAEAEAERQAAAEQAAEEAREARTVRNGVHQVGVDIEPGTYRTSGPSRSDIPMCYYARLRNNSGEFGAIISNNVVEGPAVVTVKSGEYFESSSCSGWVRD